MIPDERRWRGYRPRAPARWPGLLVADFSRILAGPYATMLLADLGADVVKVGARAATTPAPGTAGAGRDRDLLPGRQPQQAVDRARPARRRRRRARPGNWPGAPTSLIENFKPGGLAGSVWTTRRVADGNPGSSTPRSAASAAAPKGAALPGYDLIVQAISGLMSLTGDPDGPPYRAGISVFDVMAGLHATIGILSALHHATRPGAASTSRSTCCPRRCPGWSTTSSAYVAGGVVPFRMGNSHPSLFPYEPLPCADGDLIITAGNDGQFRRLCAGARPARARRRPALRPQPGPHRQPRRAAAACSIERLGTGRRRSGSTDIVEAGVPCGPINTIDGGVAFAEEIGLDPVVVGRTRGDRRCRRSATRSPLSETPADYGLPPPGLDEHGDRDPRAG